MDEPDASIHPMMVMSIVNVFRDDGVNVRYAQYVFITHDPVFLDNNLFRRYEIKFVEVAAYCDEANRRQIAALNT